MSDLRLTGFCHSVYTRSVRIALAEKGQAYAYEECNPFAATDADRLRADQPFGRVPVLRHGDFALYETAAILGYLEEVLGGVWLMPDTAPARARARQVIGMVDSYVYRPLVRQVFSHGVYAPLMGEPADAALVDAGMQAAPRILGALEEVAAEGLVLRPGAAGAAEGHLFAMLDYFVLYEPGRDLLQQHPALTQWFDGFAARDSAIVTRPDLKR
ncbi:glutathione S-transferase family protein [Shimia sediminis]|uniref:glutathione S-transferase family protein n=1 Tax=Shimia sediminis TaxID=2497945 RepID=UPI000F8DC9FC|nr:glutathione S-transferase family protein [Shimia sediminis]